MVMRRIKNAVRGKRSTKIVLECSHERSLGGHVLNNKEQTPNELIGQKYDCVEHMCGRITSGR